MLCLMRVNTGRGGHVRVCTAKRQGVFRSTQRGAGHQIVHNAGFSGTCQHVGQVVGKGFVAQIGANVYQSWIHGARL